ncbi:hypothetical protein GCM10010218_01650 [Streptomyces mashuensis]|uniref:DUF2029 domain-containing protein n=1 Tax=Streptomyces mashuensis TaxID=33904 RepID=A0A919AT04_9ACTN|nr:glycosyltransferase 87 family protein [Streptomyces mashuensis]GHF24740.1 hypothetical protein GCM10010218_01650 [Streptomyces mashuensis]
MPNRTAGIPWNLRLRNAVRRVDRRRLWIAGWLLAAAWAASFPLVSGLETHRVWGWCAAAGYGVAALAACGLPRPRARTLSLAAALTGAVALPFLYLVLTGRAQSEVGVIERSGDLMLHQVSPYLELPRSVTDYNPYLPGMAFFGLPAALAGDHGWALRLLTDARVWCAAAFLLCLAAGRRVLGGGPAAPTRTGPYGTAMTVLVASPVVALPLCVSGVDLPLAGLCCLGLALAARGRPATAGLVLAAACSLKWTAWPAIAVAAALLGSARGTRAALRCTGTALAGTLAVVLPGAVLSPGPMVQQVLAFPLGSGEVATPAGSPLPGHLLAGLGTAGWYAAVGLLVCGGVAVAASLVLRPPTGAVAAADRLAAGLCVAFLLAPAGRFGYLALPLVLVVWTRLAAGARRPVPPPAGSAPHGAPAVPSPRAGAAPVPAPLPVPAGGVR